MTRYALIATLTAALALGGYAWWQSTLLAAQRQENERLRHSIAALTLQAEQTALARDVEAARAEAFAARAATLSAEIEAILTGGIPDAPLHPDLAARLERLRGD